MNETPGHDPQLEKFLKGAPIFIQQWWLDAVAPGQWSYATVRKGQEIVAAMPYILKTRFGFNKISLAPRTSYLGPWFKESTAKYAFQLKQQKDLMNALIDELPKHLVFQQNFHPSFTNWLPFCWRGFDQSTRYTYLADWRSDPEEAWKECTESVKTDVRKAEKQLSIEKSDDFETLLKLHELTCRRQGFEPPNSKEEMFRIHQACQARHCSCCLIARDAENRPHCAIYLIWDESKVYYYLAGADPELRNSGANAFLVWNAIKMAFEMNRSFDFVGSMVEPIERFFRAFGGRQVPYFRMTRYSSKWIKAAHVLLNRL